MTRITRTRFSESGRNSICRKVTRGALGTVTTPAMRVNSESMLDTVPSSDAELPNSRPSFCRMRSISLLPGCR